MSSASILFPNLNIVLENVGKSFRIGGFEIAYYGVVIALAMLAGVTLVGRLAAKSGQDPDLYLDVCVAAMICGVIGARLYYVIFSWEDYKDHLAEILNLRGGGLAIYGGVIAGTGAVIFFARHRKLPALRFLDTICPGLALGQAIGRWGNFFNREAFGGFTDGLLAMALPENAVRSTEVTERMLANRELIDGIVFVKVHPTFLYESLWNLGLLAILTAVFGKKKYDGQIFLVYLAGYGIGRFWIESLRTDQLLLPGLGLPVSQVVAAVAAVTAVTVLLRNLNGLRMRQK